MDSRLYARVQDKKQSILIRQKIEKINIKNVSNESENENKDKTTKARIEGVLKEKEFICSESLLTQLASYSDLRSCKNILTSFGIFFCLHTISNDFRTYKK